MTRFTRWRGRAPFAALAALAATAFVTTLAAPCTLRAQDRITVAVVAPALGSFPQLTAGTFETSTTQAGTVAQPTGLITHVEMSLPWGGEAAQLLRALKSGAPLATVTCTFYHAGSDAPYYSMALHPATVEKLALAYDSASGVATEEVRFAAPHVDYGTGTAGTASAVSPTSPPAIAPRIVTIGGRQVHVLPTRFVALSRIAGAGVAGPPIAGFATFTSPTGPMPPEGGTPSWAGSQSTSVSSFAVEVDQTSIGSQSGGAGHTPQFVTFTKPLGSLSPQLQAAHAAHTPLQTVISLADRPGRLAYRITLPTGVVQSDQTSFSGNKSAEDIKMAVPYITLDNIVTAGR